MKHRIYKAQGYWCFEYHYSPTGFYALRFDSWQEAVDHFNWSLENGWPFSE